MAMRAMNVMSSPLSLGLRIAPGEVGSPQMKQLCQHRASSLLSFSGVVRKGQKSNFSVAVRAAGAAEATTSSSITERSQGTEPTISGAATEISLEELRRKGDSYFLTDTRPIILFDGTIILTNLV
jgi:hypothetical protein